jgi:hypothetical protein
LPEYGEPELVSQAGLRYQTELLATLDRPPARCRKRTVTGLAQVLAGRLGNYQSAADLEKWRGTFGRHRGRAEAPGNHCCKTSPVSLLAPELLGSSIDNLHARRQPELLDRPPQKVSGAVRRIEQDETKVSVLDRKHEARQSATGSELENGTVDCFHQQGPKELLRVRLLHREWQVACQRPVSRFGEHCLQTILTIGQAHGSASTWQ